MSASGVLGRSCAEVVEGLFMRLLSRPPGLVHV